MRTPKAAAVMMPLTVCVMLPETPAPVPETRRTVAVPALMPVPAVAVPIVKIPPVPRCTLPRPAELVLVTPLRLAPELNSVAPLLTASKVTAQQPT